MIDFGNSCNYTYNSIANKGYDEYSCNKHINIAIKQKLLENNNNGFTRENGAREIVASTSKDEIMYALINSMIQLNEFETRYNIENKTEVANQVIALLNTNDGIDTIMQYIMKGMAKQSDNPFFENFVDRLIENYVIVNKTMDVNLNQKFVSFDAQKSIEKLKNHIQEKEQINQNYNVR